MPLIPPYLEETRRARDGQRGGVVVVDLRPHMLNAKRAAEGHHRTNGTRRDAAAARRRHGRPRKLNVPAVADLGVDDPDQRPAGRLPDGEYELLAGPPHDRRLLDVALAPPDRSIVRI